MVFVSRTILTALIVCVVSVGQSAGGNINSHQHATPIGQHSNNNHHINNQHGGGVGNIPRQNPSPSHHHTPPSSQTQPTTASISSPEQLHEFKRNSLQQVCGKNKAIIDALMDYAHFHEQVLIGNAPQRYLIAVPVEAGLADRLTGIISLFWLAFFSKSAFQIGELPSKLPRFESAYDHVFINWTRPDSLMEDDMKHSEPALVHYQGQRHYDSQSINTTYNYLEYMVNDGGKAYEIYGKSDLTKYPPDPKRQYPNPQRMYISSNRGGIHFLYKNPQHANYLEHILGLKQEYAFRCTYHFLFQENHIVRDIMNQHGVERLAPSSVLSTLVKRAHVPGENELVTILPPEHPTEKELKLSTPSMIKIAIGIRAGDHSFDPKNDEKIRLQQYEHFLQCTNSITQSLPQKLLDNAKKHTQVLWYVMSDSLHLRQLIHEKYGTKVLTDYTTANFHGDCANQKYGGCSEEVLVKSITQAVAEMTLFSLADLHVVTHNSGFSRLGSELAKPPHMVFLLYRENTTSIQNYCLFGRHSSEATVEYTGGGV